MLTANLAVPCILGWNRSLYRASRGAPDGVTKELVLSIKVTSRSWQALCRFLLEGTIALFRLCLPLAGIIELRAMVEEGKTFLQRLIRSVHVSTVI